jgi:NAD-dependent deacetylase
MVIGTSLNVYPAAGLLNYVPNSVPKYLVDPNGSGVSGISNLTIIKEKAGKGVTELVKKLL